MISMLLETSKEAYQESLKHMCIEEEFNSVKAYMHKRVRIPLYVL